MAYTLELLEELGGARTYLEAIGFGPEQVQRLRERLLEPEAARRRVQRNATEAKVTSNE